MGSGCAAHKAQNRNNRDLQKKSRAKREANMGQAGSPSRTAGEAKFLASPFLHAQWLLTARSSGRRQSTGLRRAASALPRSVPACSCARGRCRGEQKDSNKGGTSEAPSAFKALSTRRRTGWQVVGFPLRGFRGWDAKGHFLSRARCLGFCCVSACQSQLSTGCPRVSEVRLVFEVRIWSSHGSSL